MFALLTAVAASSSVRVVQFSRRAALLSTCSSAALFLRPATPACAEEDDILKGIVERAQHGDLSVSKVIDRAKQNALVELSPDSLSCDVLDQIVRVDQNACDSAGASIKTLQQAMRRGSNDPIEQAQAKASLTELQTIKARIDKQVGRLVALEEEQGCLDAVATYDTGAIAQRAQVGRLSTERAIQRARSNQLVSVEDAKLGCNALDALRQVDRKALQVLAREVQQARDSGSSGGELDGLVTAEQNMRLQVSKADTRFTSYCEGVDDLTAGAM